MLSFRLTCIWIFLIFFSCNEEDDRFEVINKLRGVGIRADKPVVSGATTVNLEIFALLPAGKTVSLAESWKDAKAPAFFQADVTLNNDASHTGYGPLSLYRQTATLTVPEVSPQLLAALNGVVRLRFGVRLQEGEEEEIMVGDILSVADGDESLGWTAPSLSFESPSDGESISGPFNLRASVAKNQDEGVKPVWMVSSGKVKNLRALDTEWDEIGTGEQTVLVGVFSKKSRFFTFEIRKVRGL